MHFTNEPGVGTTIFFTDNLVLVAEHKDGKLLRCIGRSAEVQQIELDYVRVTMDGKDEFYKLGDNVKWLEVE